VVSAKVGKRQTAAAKTPKSRSKSAGKTPRQGSKKKTGDMNKHLVDLEAYRAYNVSIENC
jgi:hypothetical protein